MFDLKGAEILGLSFEDIDEVVPDWSRIAIAYQIEFLSGIESFESLADQFVTLVGRDASDVHRILGDIDGPDVL